MYRTSARSSMAKSMVMMAMLRMVVHFCLVGTCCAYAASRPVGYRNIRRRPPLQTAAPPPSWSASASAAAAADARRRGLLEEARFREPKTGRVARARHALGRRPPELVSTGDDELLQPLPVILVGVGAMWQRREPQEPSDDAWRPALVAAHPR